MAHPMKLLVGTAALLASLTKPAMAAPAWHLIGFDEPTMAEWAIDHNSLRSNRGIRKGWILTNFQSPQNGSELTGMVPYQSNMVLAYFDCAHRLSGRGQIVIYADRDAKGKVLASFETPPKMSDVTPGSIGEAILNKACALPLKTRTSPT